MTSLLTGLALCCPLAHAHGLRQFSFSFSPIPPSFLSLSLSLSRGFSFTAAQHTTKEMWLCARARICTVHSVQRRRQRRRTHRCTFTHTRTRAHSRSRALSTDCDHCRSSTIPWLVPLAPPLHHLSPVVCSPHPYSISVAHSRWRVLHTTFYLSLTFRVSFVSLVPSSLHRPPFSFYTLDISLRSLCTPPLGSSTIKSLLFFRFTVSPASLSYTLSSILSLPVTRPFLLASFPPAPLSLSTATTRPRWSPAARFTVWLLSFLPFFFHHLSRERNAPSVQSNGSARVQCLRGENRRPPFSRPQRGMGYRGPIMDLSVGCCLLWLAAVAPSSPRVRRRKGATVGRDRIESSRGARDRARPKSVQHTGGGTWTAGKFDDPAGIDLEADRDSVRPRGGYTRGLPLFEHRGNSFSRWSDRCRYRFVINAHRNTGWTA